MESASPVASGDVCWVVLKSAQRCNLNCTYCYVYNRGDDSWRSRPKFISSEVLSLLAQRIVDECEASGRSSFVVELHGGEPLLIGKARMRWLIHQLRSACRDIRLDFRLQTNGTLLDTEWIDLFAREKVRIGVSLDGPPEVADRYRVRRDGRGSTQQVLDRIRTLRESHPAFGEVFSGVLCVVNPELDGGDMVQWFADEGLRALDFLLPDGNYVNRPEGWSGVEPYIEFLASAFDTYYSLGAAAPKIRTFELMIRSFMGVRSTLDAFGGDLRQLCVVETNGAIGISDVTRMIGGVFAEDVLNVATHALSDAAEHCGVADLQRPSEICRRCPAFRACGGGYLPHRFDGASFANPSIYCEALYALAQRIYRRLREDVPDELWIEAPVAVPA